MVSWSAEVEVVGQSSVQQDGLVCNGTGSVRQDSLQKVAKRR